MANEVVVKKADKLPKAALPEVAELSEPLLTEITAAFGLDRDVIADEESIERGGPGNSGQSLRWIDV